MKCGFTREAERVWGESELASSADARVNADHYCPRLATAELYIALAVLFRRYDIKLVDTIRERDADLVVDNFTGETLSKGDGDITFTATLKNDCAR